MANQDEKPKRKALLIHDHQDTVAYAIRYLRMRDFEVLVAQTLSVARQQLKDHPEIAMVLVDGGMPKDDSEVGQKNDEVNSVTFVREVAPQYVGKVVFIGFSAAYNQELLAAGCQDACTPVDINECMDRVLEKYFS